MSSNKSIEKQIQKHKEKMDQMAEEYKRLQKLQKAEEVKEQEKRAVKLGVLLQKMMPDIVKLDEANYKQFLENTIDNGYGKRILRETLSEQKQVTTVGVESKQIKSINSTPSKPVVPSQNKMETSTQEQEISYVDDVDYS